LIVDILLFSLEVEHKQLLITYDTHKFPTKRSVLAEDILVGSFFYLAEIFDNLIFPHKSYLLLEVTLQQTLQGVAVTGCIMHLLFHIPFGIRSCGSDMLLCSNLLPS